MAASLFIEEESGTYSARIRHPHNGYYAGDFSRTPRSGSELRVSCAEHRGLPVGCDPGHLTSVTPVRVQARQQ